MDQDKTDKHVGFLHGVDVRRNSFGHWYYSGCYCLIGHCYYAECSLHKFNFKNDFVKTEYHLSDRQLKIDFTINVNHYGLQKKKQRPQGRKRKRSQTRKGKTDPNLSNVKGRN